MEPRDFSLIGRQLRQELERLAPPGGSSDEQAHVRSVERQIDALGRGDVASLLADAHDDVQLDIFLPPEFDWIRHASGGDAVRRAVEHNFGAVTDQEPELQSVVSQGETVVLMVHERGRVRATGASYDMQLVHTFTFRDGRLSSVRIVGASTR